MCADPFPPLPLPLSSLFLLSLFSLSSRVLQVERFLDELDALPDAARVSMVTLTSDVQGLRKGIDLILYEREKQQNNYIIYAFYENAVQKGARVLYASKKKSKTVMRGQHSTLTFVLFPATFACCDSGSNCGTVQADGGKVPRSVSAVQRKLG